MIPIVLSEKAVVELISLGVGPKVTAGVVGVVLLVVVSEPPSAIETKCITRFLRVCLCGKLND